MVTHLPSSIPNLPLWGTLALASAIASRQKLKLPLGKQLVEPVGCVHHRLHIAPAARPGLHHAGDAPERLGAVHEQHDADESPVPDDLQHRHTRPDRPDGWHCLRHGRRSDRRLRRQLTRAPAPGRAQLLPRQLASPWRPSLDSRHVSLCGGSGTAISSGPPRATSSAPALRPGPPSRGPWDGAG